MISAFARAGVGVGGTRAVTRAKNDISDLMRGQGRVPFRPMPRRVFPVCEGEGCGVVATMRVIGTGVVGGILAAGGAVWVWLVVWMGVSKSSGFLDALF
jgi:hypothetical protein